MLVDQLSLLVSKLLVAKLTRGREQLYFPDRSRYKYENQYDRICNHQFQGSCCIHLKQIIDSSQGMTSDHYSFDPDSSSTIPMLFACGTGADYDYHGAKQRGGGNLQLSGIDTPTCICNTGVHGSLDGVPFNKNCLPEPSADLVQQV